MCRFLFVLLGFYLVSTPLFSQIAFHDAHSLASILNAKDSLSHTDNNTLYAILRPYVQRDRLDSLSNPQIHRHFQDNPLFPQLPPPQRTQYSPARSGDSLSATFVPDKVKGITVNTVLEGSAAFLVERVKTELNLAFFNRLEQQLAQDSCLTFWLPQTQQTLESLGSEIYLYSSFWRSLQQSFRLDLQELPQHMKRYLQDPKSLTEIQPQALRWYVPSFLQAVEMSVSGKHPSHILATLADLAPLPDSLIRSESNWANLRTSFQVLNLMAQSLETQASSEAQWLAPTDLQALTQDSIRLQLYLGLLLQQSKGINFYLPQKDTIQRVPFAACLEALIHDTAQLEGFLGTCMRFLADAQEVERLLSTPPHQKDFALYLSYADRLTQLIQQGLSLSHPFLVRIPHADSLEKEVGGIFSHAIQLHISSRQHKYGASVLHFSQLQEHLFPRKWHPKLKSQWLRYGSFMAQVAQAESPESLAAILAHATLPPASAAIKKHSKFSISLNAYVGFSVGNERLKAEAELVAKDGAYAALSAPIGLALNWGLGRKNPSSLSLFASLIDIGALTAYRFENNTTEELPALKLENVWAPGLYMIWGVPKVPISLGLGIQNGPQLRKVSAQHINLANRSAWRWGAILAVDIPMFNLLLLPD